MFGVPFGVSTTHAMKLRLLSVLAPVLLTCLTPAQSRADEEKAPDPTRYPLLWQLEHDGTTHYLYGTTTLPAERITVLPDSVEKARASVQAIFTGLDVENLGPTATTQLLLTKGQTLVEVIGEPLYARVEEYCNQSGAPLAVTDRLQVWVVATQVLLSDVLRTFGDRPTLERKLASDAGEHEIEAHTLENLGDLVKSMKTFSSGQQQHMLEQALDRHGKSEERLQAEADAYLTGDTDKYMSFVSERYADSPGLQRTFEQVLVDGRSKRFGDRILAELKEHPERASLFAVDTMHLRGEHGIVDRLREAGFDLQRLDASGKPMADEPPRSVMHGSGQTSSRPARDG